jgi:hypothetical protein
MIAKKLKTTTRSKTFYYLWIKLIRRWALSMK